MHVLDGLREKKALRCMTGSVLMMAALGIGMGSASAKGEASADGAVMNEYAVEDIIVTAERMPTERMNTPADVSVITAKDIAANHFADMTEALTQTGGVTVTRQGSFSGIEINGDERVVVLVDGRRLNNDQGLSAGKGRIDLSMIPTMKNIERIEVVRGGASALYGSDAVGGVVNIITKRGGRKQKTTLDLNTGSWGTYNYELATEGSDGDFSWFITGGLQKQNHVRYKMKGTTADAPHSETDNNSFTLRLDKTLDAARSVRFDFEHKTKHEGTYYNAVNKSLFKDERRNDLFNNQAVSYLFKEDTKTPGHLRFFNNYRSTVYGASRFNTRLWGVDYQNGWELGDHTLIAGIEWHESRSSNPSAGYEGEKLRDIAGYMQDTWKLGEKWSLVPGVRVDGHNRSGTHWSPKVALNYRADEKTQVYASWGRVFQAPKADDLFWYEDWGFGTGMFGTPNLRPETGYTETLGLNHRFDDATSMSLSVFQSQLHDAITWVPQGWSWYAKNVSKEKRRGLALSFKRRLSPLWDLDLGYSYTGIQQTDATGGLAYYGRNKNPNGYHIGLKYHQGAWKAGLYGKFNSGMDERYMLARSTALLDLNVSYDVNAQATIYFKALNLTNQEFSEYPGSGTAYYPGNGRFFQLGVTYTF